MTDNSLENWQQANEIYAQLLDFTVTDAIEHLNSMPEVSDEIKALVLALVSSGNQSSQFFEKQIGASFEVSGIQVEQLNAGDLLGEYQITAELGHGGMASVYHADRTGTEKQKPVAIKVFNRTQLTPTLLNRFAIEQDVLSGLSHPNIVNMHHGGNSESGAPYIVMDLIDGAQDIDDYCLQEKLNTRQIVMLVLVAAKAIAYAHQNLIVHRDIKPSNLLVDSHGQLKVVDFGIAKLMGRSDAPQKTTIMALTPSFAAPEQINSGQISVTTDVFSLAAVLLSLLIKDTPLPQDRLIKSCAEDDVHISRILKANITDKDLRNVLNTALQLDPSKRYRNMDLLADDLTAWLAYEPVKASPDSWVYRIQKFAQRRSALFATLMTLVLTMVAGIVVLSWQVEKTKAEANKAHEVKDFMLDVFSVVNPDESLGEKILAKDLLAQAFAEIQAKEFQGQATQLELMTAIGQAQFQLGLNEAAAKSFDEALTVNPFSIPAQLGHIRMVFADSKLEEALDKINILVPQVNQNDALYAELLLLQAEINIAANKDFDEAEKNIRTAQELFSANQQIKGYLAASRTRANIMYLKSETEEAGQYLEQELKVASKQLAPIHTSILAIRTDLVDIYNDYGDYAKATGHSNQLIEDITEILGDEHPFLIKAYLSQAGTQRAIGEIAAAKENANKALVLSRKVHGEEHQSTARAINFIAVVHYVEGNIDAALANMQVAADIYAQIFGDDHPETWDIKTNLTALLNLAGRYEEAINTIEPVNQKQLEVLGARHKSTIYSQTVMVRLYVALDRLDKAQQLGESMLSVALKELGMIHPLTLGGHFALSQVYQKQGKTTAAIELMLDVINSEKWSDDNEQAITAYNSLGDLYAVTADMSSGAEYKEKSLAVAVKVLSKDSARTLNQMLNNLDFYITAENKIMAAEYIRELDLIKDSNQAISEGLKSRFEELNQQFESMD